MAPAYPVLVSYVIAAINISVSEMNFTTAAYHVKGGQNQAVNRGVNTKIRNSEKFHMNITTLSETSQNITNEYFRTNNLDLQYVSLNHEWKVLRYNKTGHFSQHTDVHYPLDGYSHFGTEIFLPPLDETYFEGGTLTIWNGRKVQNIGPHKTRWTHIIMPISLVHQVNKITKGTRISYVKPIYGKINTIEENPTNNKTPQSGDTQM